MTGTIQPVTFYVPPSAGEPVGVKVTRNLFMVFGEPDIDVRETGDGQLQVEVRGLEVYDPTTGVLRSSSVERHRRLVPRRPTTTDVLWLYETRAPSGESRAALNAARGGALMPSDVVAAAVPVLGSVITVTVTWLVNERSKRRADSYRRKERRYSGLIKAFRGFYQDGHPEDLQSFADEMAQAWLYCPDTVMRAGNSFIDAVKVGNQNPESVRRESAAEFILAMRRDLLPKTHLTAEDYRFLAVQS